MTPSVFYFAALGIFIFATLAFIPAYFLRKNDIADMIWGPGFLVAGGVAWYFGAPQRESDMRLALVFAMIGVWALRLLIHVGSRNLHKQEDVRYANWRKEWGKTWIWRSYLQVFLLQGLLLLVIDAPLFWIIAAPTNPFDGFCKAGTALWLVGFLFESISDEQLRRFKSDPSHKGKLMTTGLWSWSRHPNYFGEVLQWWGIFLLALPLKGGWVTVISPLTITFFILKVSGVPMLEKLMENRPGVAEYRKRTSEFFPLPPKKI